VLDALDPLRHYFFAVHGSNNEDILIPLQPSSAVKQIREFSFGTKMSNTHDLRPAVSISLAVDASPGCGGIAWPAGQVLADYLGTLGPEFLQGRTVLELGSGTGLVGLVSGALGAEAVWITDQAPLVDIMRHNVLLNELSSNVTASVLNWGEPLADCFPRPDLILAADCVYFEPTFPLLVQTLSDLVVDEKIEVLFCYKKRRKADKRFFGLLKKKFTWTEVMDNPDRETYSREQISLLRLFKKPYTQ